MVPRTASKIGMAAPEGAAVVFLALTILALTGCGKGECSRSERARADRYGYHDAAPAAPVVAGHVGIDSVAVFCGRIDEVHRLWGAPDAIAPEDFFRVYDYHCWYDRGVEIGVDAAGRIDAIVLLFGDHRQYGIFAGVTAEGLALAPDTREEDILALYGPVSGTYSAGSRHYRELCTAGEPFAWHLSREDGVALVYPREGYVFDVKNGCLISLRFLDCGPGDE